ncbi:MAG: Rrf2 family transcriptional regulator [Alphaproteobacteria bacterium]|nr:Rrf2 family transcriptional regulator [Alphaproteobacteria bacterium]
MAPNKLFCAMEAVLYIAYNTSGGAISSRDIAAKQHLPPRYLEGLMQKLVHAGILRGIRGPKGGYVLAKERRRISLADICTVLQEEDSNKEGGNYAATPLGKNIVMPVWEKATAVWLDTLENVNLAALCEQASEKQIKKHAEEKLDFTI